MAYINLDPNYFEHPKTVRLMALCGPRSEIMPIRLWAYAARFHPDDGLMKSYSAVEVEGAARWDGEAGQLAAAMVKVGFLDQVEDGFKLHDWEEHEGHIIAFAKRAKAGATARWLKIYPDGKPSNAKSEPSNASSNASSNAPYRTVPIRTLPIRTKPKNSKGGDSGGAGAPPDTPPSPPAAAKRYIPTTDAAKAAVKALNGCERIKLNKPEIIEDWLKAFPVVDLAAEIKKAEAWLKSNGDHKKNYARYLNNWFGRQMDRPRGGGMRPPRQVGSAAPEPGKYS